MKKELVLDNFSGPLDLLLQLIQGEKMEITEVSLAHVTEQFLEYLEQVEEKQPDELADFLTVATQLLLLKAQSMLPYFESDEEQDPGELEAQLKMYKTYVDAMVDIEALMNNSIQLFPRKQMKVQRDVSFNPPEGVMQQELRGYFVDVLQRLEPVVRIPKAAMEKVVSLRQKLSDVQNIITKHVKVQFTQLINDSQNRGDVVVTFLAILELVKQRTVTVQQDDAAGEIHIERIME